MTYLRDLAVRRWCRERGVRWTEWPQFGVVRRLPSRDGAGRGAGKPMRGRRRLPAPERLPSVPLPGQSRLRLTQWTWV